MSENTTIWLTMCQHCNLLISLWFLLGAGHGLLWLKGRAGLCEYGTNEQFGFSSLWSVTRRRVTWCVSQYKSAVSPVFHGWRRRGGKSFAHQAGVCVRSKLQEQCQLLLHSCSDSHRYLQRRQVNVVKLVNTQRHMWLNLEHTVSKKCFLHQLQSFWMS